LIRRHYFLSFFFMRYFDARQIFRRHYFDCHWPRPPAIIFRLMPPRSFAAPAAAATPAIPLRHFLRRFCHISPPCLFRFYYAAAAFAGLFSDAFTLIQPLSLLRHFHYCLQMFSSAHFDDARRHFASVTGHAPPSPDIFAIDDFHYYYAIAISSMPFFHARLTPLLLRAAIELLMPILCRHATFLSFQRH
jgi:hypothetical protein